MKHRGVLNGSVQKALCLKLSCKNMLYTIHYSGKSGMQNIILFTTRSTKNVKLIAQLGIFRHYCVFILEFFKQAVTKVFKVIMQLSFHL